MKTWQKIGLGLLIFYGVLLNLYLGILATCRDCVAFAAQTNYIAEYILLIGVSLCLGLFIFQARKWVWVLFLPSVLAFGALYMPMFTPKAAADVEGQPITVASFNILRDHDNTDDIIAILEDFDADIIGLFELNYDMPAKLQTELGDEYPYQFTQVEAGYDGMGILSRYPITEQFVVINENDKKDVHLDKLGYMRVELDMAGQALVVYLVHPPIADIVPLISYDDTHLQEEIGQAIAAMQQETNPLIMLCDCNSAPLTNQHDQLDALLDDAFAGKGWGWGLTFKGLPFSLFPIFRIDYIWHSEHFAVQEVKVWEESGSSDHYPLWAQLVLQQGKESHGQQTLEHHAGNVNYRHDTGFFGRSVQYSG